MFNILKLYCLKTSNFHKKEDGEFPWKSPIQTLLRSTIAIRVVGVRSWGWSWVGFHVCQIFSLLFEDTTFSPCTHLTLNCHKRQLSRRKWSWVRGKSAHTNQHTMQDGWCVDGKQFLDVFMSHGQPWWISAMYLTVTTCIYLTYLVPTKCQSNYLPT